MVGNSPLRGFSVYSTSPTDDWSKPSRDPDHVCRPVIVDAQGRKRPIVSYGSQQTSDLYVTTTETIVKEHVLSPFASDYRRTPYSSHDSLQGYEVEEAWMKPYSPVDGRPQKVDEILTNVQTEASKPKFGPSHPSNWRQTTKPTGFSPNSGGYSGEYKDFNNHDWQKHGGNDEYFSKQGGAKDPSEVHNGGWGRPSHTPWGGTSRSSVNSKPASDISAATGYSKEPVKPSQTTVHHHPYAEPVYTETIYSRDSIPIEPTVVSNGGWVKPSAGGWASPPASNLSSPINNINMAIEVLKEAAKPSFPPRYTEPGYTETIDSTEAARRYKFNFPARPYTKQENYTTTIDSKEAARKYRGTTV